MPAFAFLLLLSSSIGTSLPISIRQGDRLWSQVHGGVAAGADVTISGDTWLDVSPPPLGTITIPAGSGLYFAYRPTASLVLNATNILVYGTRVHFLNLQGIREGGLSLLL